MASCNPTDSASTTSRCCTPLVVVIASCNPSDSASTTDRCFPTPVPENEVRTASCNPTDSENTTGRCCTPIVGVVIESCNPTDSENTTDRFFPTPVPENEVRTASCNPTDSASTTDRCCTPHCVILCILSLFVSAT